MQILAMLKPKLLNSILLDLEKMKSENEEWTVKNFRKLLQRHINAKEACDLQKKRSLRSSEKTLSQVRQISKKYERINKSILQLIVPEQYKPTKLH